MNSGISQARRLVSGALAQLLVCLWRKSSFAAPGWFTSEVIRGLACHAVDPGLTGRNPPTSDARSATFKLEFWPRN